MCIPGMGPYKPLEDVHKFLKIGQTKVFNHINMVIITLYNSTMVDNHCITLITKQ